MVGIHDAFSDLYSGPEASLIVSAMMGSMMSLTSLEFN